jgi:hypothetical protein
MRGAAGCSVAGYDAAGNWRRGDNLSGPYGLEGARRIGDHLGHGGVSLRVAVRWPSALNVGTAAGAWAVCGRVTVEMRDANGDRRARHAQSGFGSATSFNRSKAQGNPKVDEWIRIEGDTDDLCLSGVPQTYRKIPLLRRRCNNLLSRMRL